jgi:hypothetical protein
MTEKWTSVSTGSSIEHGPVSAGLKTYTCCRKRDPEGALTLARTLLETVIKHILDDDRVEYEKSADLPSLYKMLAEHLNLAPTQHDREAFKAILGGVATVVSRLAQLRNSYSDSHGKADR